MGRRVIDLTGQTFGTWQVLGAAPGPHPLPGAYWLCRCDPARGGCGATAAHRGVTLRQNQTLRCRACYDAARPTGWTRGDTVARNADIRQRRAGGATLAQIATEFDLSPQRVQQILSAKPRARRIRPKPPR